MATDLQEKNRNLPGQEPEKKALSPQELTELDQIEAGLRDNISAVNDLAQRELVSDYSDPNQAVQKFHEENLKISPDGSRNSAIKNKEQSKKYSSSNSQNSSGLSSSSEAQSLSSTIDKYNQEWVNDIGERIKKEEGNKVSKLNLRGRARKRIRLLALGAVFAVAAAVPIGILGVIPHALQGWIQNRVAAYTERAVDKMGQKVLYSYMKNRVAIEKCKEEYNLAGNTAGIVACRPRLNERDTRLSQLFNDWNAAKLEDKLADRGINVEYNYAERSNGKPYKITINRPESEGGNFQVSGEFGVPDLDSAEFVGSREASIILRREIKATLKEDTRWNQYLKRRNLKAGYLRDLGLPGRVFPSERVAKTLDNIDAVKLKGVSEFRQYLTKFVVNNGNARIGTLLEILLSGESSKGKPDEVIKSNKALRAASEKLGSKEVADLLGKYAGKNLQEIEIQIVKNILGKISASFAEYFGEAAGIAVPVIGWVLLGLLVLDALDLASDGTLQQYLSIQNAQSLLDAANFLDTITSEEKRSYVDLASAGDMRLSLINGLGSSRLFASLIGYESVNGKQPEGYNCKPNVSISDPASLGGAIEEVFKNGDPANLPQVGMADDQLTCENHRVDYDPLDPLSSLFSFVQNGVGPYSGLGTYTDGCVLTLLATSGISSQPDAPLCPSLQEVYHGAQGGFSWVIERIGLNKVFELISNLPPIKALMSNVTGWMSNGVAILINGQSLTGPELLQGGLNTDTKSGARFVDAWIGGGEVQQFAFAKGVGDGGGLGGIPLTPEQAASLNSSIAMERREELASSSFFDRIFDISHADTLASGLIGVAVTEGGVNNFINPFNNIALAVRTSTKTTFADSNNGLCSKVNKKGQAVTDFGTVCYGMPDSYIDGLSEDQIQNLADPEFCESQTAGIDAERKAAEESTDISKKDPDGTGTSTRIDGCRLLCTVTDSMGTEFRTGDKICGFEQFDDANEDLPSESSSDDTTSLAGALGKCESVAVSRPNDGKPKNDIEIQIVPGTSIDIRSEYCTNVKNMVDAAAADGLTLDGGGFRTYDEQVALRRQNCGSSMEAILYLPSGSCNPPTARPGTSNHEGGIAIDFRSCSTRATACYKWLAQNAAKYGFKNFPREPWHWSTNGK